MNMFRPHLSCPIFCCCHGILHPASGLRYLVYLFSASNCPFKITCSTAQGLFSIFFSCLNLTRILMHQCEQLCVWKCMHRQVPNLQMCLGPLYLQSKVQSEQKMSWQKQERNDIKQKQSWGMGQQPQGAEIVAFTAVADYTAVICTMAASTVLYVVAVLVTELPCYTSCINTQGDHISN